MTKIWESCPDCMRSDGHHPHCPSEHLPLAGDYERDDIDAFKEERDRQDRERVFRD